MTDFLKSDPTALRHFILFEVLQGTPIDKAYSKFCKVIGDDVMEYQEFDFWYFRFWNKDYDLNFERDKDKKTYELSDMPLDVMEKIVEKLDIFDRKSLSKTSRSLQTFVGDQKLFHRTLKLTVFQDRIFVSFGVSVVIQYTEDHYGCKKIFKNNVTNVQCYRKRAFLDLKSFLKNPKLHLETLNIESAVDYKKLYNDLEDALKFTHYLNFKNVLLAENASLELQVKVLPMLKPGYLTTININLCYVLLNSMNTSFNLTKVFEMEQWKQAKYFKMIGVCFIGPLHHLYHFKEFTVSLERLSVGDIRQIKEVLFKSPDFEKCSVRVVPGIDRSIIEQKFGNALRKNPDIYHYPIPNTTDYFEIKVHRFCFEVTRKKL